MERLSAIGWRLAAIGYRLAAGSYRLAAGGWQLAVCRDRQATSARQQPLRLFCIPGGAPSAPTEVECFESNCRSVVTDAAPGRGMQNKRSSSVTQFALDVVASSRSLVDTVQRRDRDLGSQLRRALSSVPLNLAEGFGSSGGNTRVRFHTAYGSLREARTAISVAISWGYVSEAAAESTLEGLDRLGGRLFGLLRS